MRRRRRLGDRLAGPARVLLAHVLDHLPLARHQLQRLGHVLAQLAQRAAAARAGRRRRVDHALARQMLGQRPARRLAPLEGLHRYRLGGRHLRLRSPAEPASLLELEQLQLELVQQRAALRRLAELLVPQLGDRVLQLLDQQRRARAPAASAGQARRPLGQQHRLQRLDVVGKGIIGRRGHSAIVGIDGAPCNGYPIAESRCRSDLRIADSQPAACGRIVRCGNRQSMPFQQIAELRRRDRHRLVRRRTATRSGRAPAAWPTGTCPGHRARGP